MVFSNMCLRWSVNLHYFRTGIDVGSEAYTVFENGLIQFIQHYGGATQIPCRVLEHVFHSRRDHENSCPAFSRAASFMIFHICVEDKDTGPQYNTCAAFQYDWTNSEVDGGSFKRTVDRPNDRSIDRSIAWTESQKHHLVPSKSKSLSTTMVENKRTQEVTWG